MKIPLILSDIKIHREQVKNKAQFFNSKKSNSLSKVLLKIWNKKNNKNILNKNLLNSNLKRIKIFHDDFASLVEKTLNFYEKK